MADHHKGNRDNWEDVPALKGNIFVKTIDQLGIVIHIDQDQSIEAEYSQQRNGLEGRFLNVAESQRISQ